MLLIGQAYMHMTNRVRLTLIPLGAGSHRTSGRKSFDLEVLAEALLYHLYGAAMRADKDDA